MRVTLHMGQCVCHVRFSSSIDLGRVFPDMAHGLTEREGKVLIHMGRDSSFRNSNRTSRVIGSPHGPIITSPDPITLLRSSYQFPIVEPYPGGDSENPGEKIEGTLFCQKHISLNKFEVIFRNNSEIRVRIFVFCFRFYFLSLI